MKSAIWALALAMCIVPACWAVESAESWDNLKQLRNGQKIEVLNTDMKSVKGTFMSCTGDGITLQTDTGPITIERPHVVRVSLRERPKRVRNALIGLAFGATLGAAIAGCTLESPCEWPPSEKSAIGAGAGAAAGALVGAAATRGSTIYRARKLPPSTRE